MTHRSLAIITGGSRGIGRFLVQSFLAHTDVLNVSRTPARTVGDASGRGHRLYDLSLDLADPVLVEPSLRAWFDEHPDHRVSTLIHNAALSLPGWLHEVSGDEVERMFRVNVHSPLALTGAVTRAGRFAPDGARVVYVTSSLARPLPELSFAGLGLYSMTKAALNRMALVQAREFELTAPHVTVLRAHPGIVDTDLQRRLRRKQRLDPAFTVKNAGLPPYREGEWDDVAPRERMRTISPEFSAEFIAWVARFGSPSEDYDFYHAEEFHAARRPVTTESGAR